MAKELPTGREVKRLPTNPRSRRAWLRGMVYGVVALAATRYVTVADGQTTENVAPAKAGTQTSFDVTRQPFNADQSGNTDCTAAFQAALTAIETLGHGELYVPAGLYRLDSPITCTGASLTIVGEGSSASVLIINHAATALTVTCGLTAECVQIRDIGFTPTPGGGRIAGAAIAITHPGQPSGWTGCDIRNVDIGVPYPAYTSFRTGLLFTNLWRGHIENVNWHSNVSNTPGTSFVTLEGTSIDNFFKGCTIDGVDTGFVLGAYAEGLHIVDCVVIGLSGLKTGSTVYRGNGVSTPYVNLLGLYISGSEFNTIYGSLNLLYTVSAFISDTHFSTQISDSPAALMIGCSLMHLSNCTLTGAFNENAPVAFNGIYTAASTIGVPANGVAIDGCCFTNLSCGIYYGPGTVNSNATGVRMFSPNNATLVSTPIAVNGFQIAATYDGSGNSTNGSATIGSTPMRRAELTKFSFSK